MTIKKILAHSRIIDHHEAELLLAHTLGKPREFIVAHPEAKAGLFDYWKFKWLIHKRKKGVPIAYLTGYKEFYGMDFVVNRHVLIPRPETEVLVDAVLDQLRVTSYELLVTFIDVGTGSGCIPISVIKTLKHESIKAIGIDISKSVLKVARKNAEKHDVEIEFLQGNLLQPVLDNLTIRQLDNSAIVITANLPYLTDAQYRDEPTIQHEPKSALVADDNGLALYEKLLQQVSFLIITYHLSLIFFLEIDPSQSSRITMLINNYFPSAKVEIKKDLAGRDRVACVHL